MKPNKVTVCFNPSVFEVHTKAQGNTLCLPWKQDSVCTLTYFVCFSFFFFFFLKRLSLFQKRKTKPHHQGALVIPYFTELLKQKLHYVHYIWDLKYIHICTYVYTLLMYTHYFICMMMNIYKVWDFYILYFAKMCGFHVKLNKCYTVICKLTHNSISVQFSKLNPITRRKILFAFCCYGLMSWLLKRSHFIIVFKKCKCVRYVAVIWFLLLWFILFLYHHYSAALKQTYNCNQKSNVQQRN